MKEIGGYLEWEQYQGKEYHEKGLALNSGRNCLAYLLKTRKIKKILIPRLICSSIIQVCRKEGVDIGYYSIDLNFRPILPKVIEKDTYIYIINYYGQIENQELRLLTKRNHNVIVDNAQAFFQKPLKDVDTIYTCRKFFGVTDGAYLYAKKDDGKIELQKDCSAQRMEYLFGRYEKNANDFFDIYRINEKRFEAEEIKLMSDITHNMMRSFEYKRIEKKREENFCTLHDYFNMLNKLSIIMPKAPYMYPLLINNNGEKVRKKLQNHKIYIPILWPNVIEECEKKDIAYYYAANILPLPCDQRYSKDEMLKMAKVIREFCEEDL